jgi:hypothetical protein
LLRNNVIAHNRADYGGGIYSSMNGSISNDTIVGNSAIYGGGIYGTGPEELPTAIGITNSILWGNTATEGNEIALTGISRLDSSYNSIKDGAAGIHIDPNSTLNWGQGNIDADPLFANPTIDDYHLLPNSPCIDAGDPNYVVDPNEHDIDGDNRVIGGRIDMGADEHRYDDLCDLLHDGIVDFRDFSILANYWLDYVCEAPDWCTGADFDKSGSVDTSDLATFVNYWLESR